MSDLHTIIRTSPKGEGQKFEGTCSKCGLPNLTFADMNSRCENVRGISQEESLLETLKSPPPVGNDR